MTHELLAFLPNQPQLLQKKQSLFVHLAMAAAVVVYMLLGAVVFMWLEAGGGHGC